MHTSLGVCGSVPGGLEFQLVVHSWFTADPQGNGTCPGVLDRSATAEVRALKLPIPNKVGNS